MGEKKFKEIQREFFSTGDIAKLVSRSTETIRREISAGRLPAFRFRGDYAIRVSDYEAWKAKHFTPVK